MICWLPINYCMYSSILDTQIWYMEIWVCEDLSFNVCVPIVLFFYFFFHFFSFAFSTVKEKRNPWGRN